MQPLRFLLDFASPSSAGGERLKVELARAVDRTCPSRGEATVLRRADQAGLASFERIAARTVERRIRTRSETLRWLDRGVPAWARRLSADATMAASGFFSARLAAVSGVVGTTNNLLPFMPEVLGDDLSLRRRLRLRITRQVILRCLRRADRVVLHSHLALRKISEHTPELPAKTTVVLTGVPEDARLAGVLDHPYGGRPYFLYFSPIKPYKNHRNLIEAYRRLRGRVPDLPDLLFAGHRSSPSYLEALLSAIRAGSLEGRVRYLGELERESIPAWMHHATGNLFPSLCETNSIIQAEILGAGGVMAASARPPMTEVAGGAAELFDPGDPDDMARVMELLWRDPRRREELRQAAARRAAELSWEECGEVLWRAAGEAADLYRVRTAG